MRWSEQLIAGALARQVFHRKHLVIVPNCMWTGYELDLLIVTPDLRIIDVEVKISRADFKADAKKDKWLVPIPYDQYYYRRQCARMGKPVPPRARLEWPRSVWKHYYALPKTLWNDDLADHIKTHTPRSGVILMTASANNFVHAHIERRSQPRRDATKISPEDAVNLARLASLRMWDAYKELQAMQSVK